MMTQEKQIIWRRVIFSVVAMAAILIFGFVGFKVMLGMREAPPRQPRTVPQTAVKVMVVDRTNYQDYVEGYGQVTPLVQTKVEPEVAGKVIEVSDRLEPGNSVEKGQVLVKIEQEDFLIAKQEAQGNLDQTQSQIKVRKIEIDLLSRQVTVAKQELEVARAELTRFSKLLTRERVSQSEVDQQKLQVSLRQRSLLGLKQQVASKKADSERLQGELKLRRAQLKRATTNLGRTEIAAPFGGIIVERRVQLGSRVAPGVVLFSLLDPKNLEVAVSIKASHYGEITTESNVKIRGERDGPVKWTGTVSRISPDIDIQNRTFQVYIHIKVTSSSKTPFPPGAFVVAEFQGRVYRDVIAVPRAAFVGQTVYVVDTKTIEKNQAVVRSRELSNFVLLDDVALVGKGLKKGDLIAITSVEDIGNGSRVAMVRSGEKPSGKSDVAARGGRQ